MTKYYRALVLRAMAAASISDVAGVVYDALRERAATEVSNKRSQLWRTAVIAAGQLGATIYAAERYVDKPAKGE